MTDNPSRREELTAAALVGEVDEEEREFDRACASDPTVVRDLNAMRATADRLERARLSWQEQDPPPGLAERVIAATAGATPAPRQQRGRSRVALLGAVAAVLREDVSQVQIQDVSGDVVASSQVPDVQSS